MKHDRVFSAAVLLIAVLVTMAAAGVSPTSSTGTPPEYRGRSGTGWICGSTCRGLNLVNT